MKNLHIISLRTLGTSSNVNNPNIQKKVNDMETSIKGLGMNGTQFKNIINQIKTPEEMGTVLIPYNNKFKKPLFKGLTGEMTITWSTIWGIVKKFATPEVKLNYCKVADPAYS